MITTIHHPADHGLVDTEVASAGEEMTVIAYELRDRTEVFIVNLDTYIALRNIGPESGSCGSQHLIGRVAGHR